MPRMLSSLPVFPMGSDAPAAQIVAGVASLVPAWRASHIDPVVALRSE